LRDFYCLTKKETFLFRTSESLKYETTKCELAYLIDVQSFTILKEIINVGHRLKFLNVVLVATTTTTTTKTRGCYGTMPAALEIKLWQTQQTLHQQKVSRWIVRFSFQLI
jgi:hypothetical protein